MSRLDCFLLSENLIESWGVDIYTTGSRSISDHCPIWIKPNRTNWGPKSFKCFSYWYGHPDFVPFVLSFWSNVSIQGKKVYRLKEKLRRLKDKLKVWNREVFGLLNLNVEEAIAELNSLDVLVVEAVDSVSKSVSDRREEETYRVWQTLDINESLLRDKSRMRSIVREIPTLNSFTWIWKEIFGVIALSRLNLTGVC